MLSGAHVSIAGGIDKSIDNALKIGANCIQSFASSPRSYAFNEYDSHILQSYREKRQEHGIKLHVFHGIYLINLAHEKPEMRGKGINSLISYQRLAKEIDVLGTIFHIGSHKGVGFDATKPQVANAIAEVINSSPKEVWLLLENAAGHHGTIGQSITELAQIIEAVEQTGAPTQHLGICLDTQHAFASGYNLQLVEGVEDLVTEIEQKIGLDKLKVIHVNDSKTPFNSHRDRHENIDAGEIGQEGLSHIVTHPKLQHLPFILEVPGKNGTGPEKEDVEALKALARK